MKLKIVKDSFVPAKTFFENLQKDISDSEDQDIILDETSHGIRRQQMIPFLYLHKCFIEEIIGGMSNPKVKTISADLKIEDVVAYPQIGLKILSLKDSLVFYLEYFDNPIGTEYKPTDSHYYHFFTCKRDTIICFKKKGEVDFLGVKAKKSLEVAYNARYGARGLIGRAIFMGVTKLATNAEDDLGIMKGELFELEYNYKSEVKSILVVSDVDYIDNFNSFLEKNWSITIPEKVKNKEGCYIATACLDSYNHPIVYDLRNFRDNYLKKYKLGKRFIKFYYKFSPSLACVIKKSPFLKNVSLVIVIRPLHKISKVLHSKNVF